jgi:hypothetical protein
VSVAEAARPAEEPEGSQREQPGSPGKEQQGREQHELGEEHGETQEESSQKDDVQGNNVLVLHSASLLPEQYHSATPGGSSFSPATGPCAALDTPACLPHEADGVKDPAGEDDALVISEYGRAGCRPPAFPVMDS